MMEHILHTMMEDFHTSIQAGTHPAHNDGRALHLHSSRMEPHPTAMMEYFRTSIQARTTSYQNDERALHLHPSRMEHILHTMMEGLALISDLVGTNPTVISEWPLVLN